MRYRRELLRLGGDSACPGERIEPAIELVEAGDIDYIIFDSLSESEMLAFERERMSRPDAGYDVYTERSTRRLICSPKEKPITVFRIDDFIFERPYLDSTRFLLRTIAIDTISMAATTHVLEGVQAHKILFASSLSERIILSDFGSLGR